MSQNLQFLTIPDDNDWLYIVDINGGRNGVNPRTKRITYKNLLANANVDLSIVESRIEALEDIASPSTIKTFANSNDYFIGTDNSGSYKITKANLLAGLSSDGSSSNSSGWTLITGNTTLATNGKYLINTANEITLSFPPALGEVEIFNRLGAKVNIDLDGAKFGTRTLESPIAVFNNNYARYLYVDSNVGWIALSGNISGGGFGIPLLRIQGSFNDQSTFERVVTVAGSTPPVIAIGIDDQPVIRFSGSSGQQISVPFFLSGSSGATLYIVYTMNSVGNYNLVQTANIDDYWRFSNNSAGYLGTFRSGRFEAYPLNMPSSGSHLIAIHATNNSYEVLQNNVSKGVRTDNTYNAGDRFVIGANGKPFTGDIALALVYPYHTPGSSDAQLVLTKIKQTFPSLPFTL